MLRDNTFIKEIKNKSLFLSTKPVSRVQSLFKCLMLPVLSCIIKSGSVSLVLMILFLHKHIYLC